MPLSVRCIVEHNLNDMFYGVKMLYTTLKDIETYA